MFTRYRIAVYVDGCFWHGCDRHGTKPQHNAWYWGPKIAGNRARDRRATAALRRQGWQVLRFWEHDDPGRVADEILRIFRSAQQA